MGCLQSKRRTEPEEVVKNNPVGKEGVMERREETEIKDEENNEEAVEKKPEDVKERKRLVRWKSELFEILNPSSRKITDGLAGKTAVFQGFSPSFY